MGCLIEEVSRVAKWTVYYFNVCLSILEFVLPEYRFIGPKYPHLLELSVSTGDHQGPGVPPNGEPSQKFFWRNCLKSPGLARAIILDSCLSQVQ